MKKNLIVGSLVLTTIISFGVALSARATVISAVANTFQVFSDIYSSTGTRVDKFQDGNVNCYIDTYTPTVAIRTQSISCVEVGQRPQ